MLITMPSKTYPHTVDMPALVGEEWDKYLFEAFGPELDFSGAEASVVSDIDEDDDKAQVSCTDTLASKAHRTWQRVKGVMPLIPKRRARVRKSEFQAWADHCTQIVPGLQSNHRMIFRPAWK